MNEADGACIEWAWASEIAGRNQAATSFVPTGTEGVPLSIVRNAGVVLALLLAVFAWGLDHLLDRAGVFSPGGGAIAMFTGMAFALASGVDLSGARVLVARLLPVAIVLLGFELDFSVISGAGVGVAGAGAVAATVITSFGVAIVAGRLLGLDAKQSFALGAGGAICGSSAVLVVAPLLGLRNDKMALVLAAINLLGLAMFVVVIAISGVLGLSAVASGVWAGSAIHAVPQAIAAGETLGREGLAVATAVKLTRVTLLLPLVPLLGVVGQRLRDGESGVKTPFTLKALKLPLFVPGFIIAAVVGNLLPYGRAIDVAGDAAHLMLLPVLAAVGLVVTRRSLRQSGGTVLLVGSIATIALAAASLLAVLLLAN